jgi:adenosine deaminase
VYIPHHRDRLGSDDFVIEVILDELRAAAARFGIAAGLMVSSDRTLPPEDAVDQARLAVAYRGQGVVSFGLANDEAAAGPEPFAAAFAIIRDAGLLSVPHAGEHRGAESVRGALDALGADRIEHGVRAVEDAELVKRLADTGVCLDVCPTSNVMLSVCPSVSEHPLPALLAAGVRCSVNADDPLLFGPNLLAEYELCRDGLALADVDLAAVALASIAASGAPEALKKEALAAIDRWMGP